MTALKGYKDKNGTVHSFGTPSGKVPASQEEVDGIKREVSDVKSDVNALNRGLADVKDRVYNKVTYVDKNVASEGEGGMAIRIRFDEAGDVLITDKDGGNVFKKIGFNDFTILVCHNLDGCPIVFSKDISVYNLIGINKHTIGDNEDGVITGCSILFTNVEKNVIATLINVTRSI